VTPTAQTAAQIWAQKAQRLVLMNEFKQALVANGGTPNAAFNTEMTTLVTETTAYVAGYGLQF
jgi:hypothetical protein